jgi:two-component system invasion response regulator UvrY
MVRLLLVDGHSLVRAALKHLLLANPEVESVTETGSGEEAICVARTYCPDIILMDVTIPGIGGLEAARRLLRVNPRFKIIALTVQAEGPLPLRMLEAGAMGYLTKGCTPDEVLQAIAVVQRGEQYVCAEIAQRIVKAHVNGQHSRIESLTRRELQVLIMVSQGRKNQEISEHLSLSPKTISTYRTRLFNKLGVRTDVALAHIALRHGLVEPRSTA